MTAGLGSSEDGMNVCRDYAGACQVMELRKIQGLSGFPCASEGVQNKNGGTSSMCPMFIFVFFPFIFVSCQGAEVLD